MYLLINNTQYPVTRRRVTADSIIYSGVTTEPEVTGVIQMYSNEDFLFSEDTVSDYLRYTYEGTTLTLTNLPEPEPVPEPEPGPYIPTDHDVLNAFKTKKPGGTRHNEQYQELE